VRLSLHAPADFNRMQSEAGDVALAWRLAARSAFSEAFNRGYRVVDFLFDRASGGGHYLLARE
jgi:predicted GNAT superfamily acetyltransferase